MYEEFEMFEESEMFEEFEMFKMFEEFILKPKICKPETRQTSNPSNPKLFKPFILQTL